ncbi:MAG: hypothetical protein MMC23_005381 [Stictis urceolatum]|nr:hypothetical protein [Stictis urceolata]
MAPLDDLYASCPLTSHPDSLRLLRRAPIGSNGPPGPLHFTLQAFEPEERPPYIALSYTWGTPFRDPIRRKRYEEQDPKRVVYCNGIEVATTPNLYDALSAIDELSSVSKAGLHGNDVDGSFFEDLSSPYEEKRLEHRWKAYAARPWILSALISSASLDLDCHIWIDAICINQADPLEKASHVSGMNHVYAEAEKVLAWIGPESDEDRKAPELFNTYTPRLAAWKEKSCPDKRNLTPEDLEMVGLGNPREFASAYAAFFERSYFYRAWIQQEIILATNLTILCGRTPIRLVHLEYFMDFVLDSDTLMGNRHRPAPSWEEFGDTCGGRLAATQWLRILKTAKQENIVAKILKGGFGIGHVSELRAVMCAYIPCYYRRFECVDARDKLYAGLGLLDTICPPAEGEQMLAADYVRSKDELYTKWITFHLLTTPLLHILSWVDIVSDPKARSLPSWVPDFNAQYSPGPNPSRHNTFNASKWNDSVLPQRRVSDKHLFLMAKRLCIVEVLDLEPLANITKNDSNSLRSLLLFCTDMGFTYVNGQDRVTALWRTLICNMGKSLNTAEPYPARDDYGTHFSSYIRSALGELLREVLGGVHTGAVDFPIVPASEEQIATIGDFKEAFLMLNPLAKAHPKCGLPTIQDVVDYAAERGSPPESRAQGRSRPQTPSVRFAHTGPQIEFVHALYECSRKRRLFRSTSGLVGLCPVSSQPHDEVWILREARDPYMFRRDNSSGHLGLVGECYVHGYMDGEAIRGDPDEFEEICTV